MGSKFSSLYFIVLFGCSCLFAQQQAPFYYYKGKQILLPVDSQYFLVYADAKKISGEQFAKEYHVTEWVEDGGDGLIEAQVSIPNGNYDSVVNVLKAHNYVVDVEPVIGDNYMHVNTSRLFYVKLREAHDYPLLCDLSLRTGVEIKGEVAYCENWYELSVDKNSTGNSIEISNKFWETGSFANVDPGFLFHFESVSVVSTCVTDPRFAEQWGLQAIKACSAWKITTGDTSVRIAVIDKGIDEKLREFDSTCVCLSFDMDFLSSPARIYCEEQLDAPNRDQNHPNDPPVCVYHGINVGGVIFANHNRDSIAGVCPNAGLINISNTFKLREDSIASKTARAINMSVLYGARVINNSWRIKDTISAIASELLEDAINNALLSNCVVVFAAGNGNDGIPSDCVSYPARCNPDILTVGAITPSFVLSHCSNYGDGLDVVAPGVDILSTHNNNGYSYSQGTSMAAPHVSGVAGLMFSINSGLTGQDVRNIIEQTAIKNSDYNTDTLLENGTWCSFYGYGLLDAHRAVLKAAYHKVYGDTAIALCDTSVRAYTVRAPHNANIDSVSFFWTCTDNLQIVAGQSTDSVWVKRIGSGAAQLHCHILHDGDTVTSSIEIPVVSDYPVYDNIALNHNITYPDTFVLSREVVVDSLSGLTWQDKTILCTPDCRIVVRPGGFMTIDHSTLTTACPGRMWQGIEVTGDRTKPQLIQSQGILYVQNGSVIENARTALQNALSADSSMTSGGIVHAFSSTFRNNGRAVRFHPYVWTSPAGMTANYVSSFKRCTFVMDDSNLLSANGMVFAEHVKLCDVKGIAFEGCVFADSTSVPVTGRRGIYTEDAGLRIDTYCDADYTNDCECPATHSTYSTFSGFTTAVEVNTSGNPYSVTVNQARFSNNVTGVRINGNNFTTVTRCNFDLQDIPLLSTTWTGLYLDNCTGYHVEENVFWRQSEPSTLGKGKACGIVVNNSGELANGLYRNSFGRMSYGIYVLGNNAGTRNGLQMTCNTFNDNDYDIFVNNGATLHQNQGGTVGADNTFKGTLSSSFYNAGNQSVTYSYSNSTFHQPYLPHNVSTFGLALANGCPSMLCSGGTPKSLAGFQSDMNIYTAVHSAAPSGATEPQPNTHTVGAAEPQPNAQSLADMRQSLSATYHTAVRALMADSLLDLNELEQWHVTAQSLADPYSLTETRFVEGYAEAFAADANDADANDAEMANYAEFHAMKVALRDNDATVETQNFASLQTDNHVNWYALTPAQIAQLQAIAERNTGRASVMAKGVLCFFHGICYEDEWADTVNIDDPVQTNLRTRHSARSAEPQTNTHTLTVYPNPTDDLLHIELAGGAGIIASAALYDLQGRTVRTRFIAPASSQTATVDMRNVPAGVYMLRVTDGEGKEYGRKVVKR